MTTPRDLCETSTGDPSHRAAGALALAELLRPDGVPQGTRPPPLAELRSWVEARIATLGLPRPAPILNAPDEPDGEDDPRELLYWLLRMAVPTYHRALDPLPPVDVQLVSRLEALLARRPRPDDVHCQMPVDATSSLRRALVVQDHLAAAPGPVLCVGDDDGVTLALALLGVTDLHAIDVDERLLAYLEDTGRSLGVEVKTFTVDVFEDPAPAALAARCAAVLTDPIRSYEPCLAFLSLGAECLRRDRPSCLLWADHPDWNFELEAVLEALPSLGLSLRALHEDTHRYPVTATWVPDVEAKAHALSVDPGWLAGLLSHVAGYTHLYVLEPARARADLRRSPS